MNNAAGLLVLFGVVILSIVLAGAVLFSNISESRQAAAQYEIARGNAEAAIIRAQAQAQAERVQGLILLMYGSLPFGVLLIVGLLGLSVIALAVVVAVRPRPQPNVEQQVIYLMAPPVDYPVFHHAPNRLADKCEKFTK